MAEAKAGALIEVENVAKSYVLGGQDVHALKGVSLAIGQGGIAGEPSKWNRVPEPTPVTLPAKPSPATLRPTNSITIRTNSPGSKSSKSPKPAP